MSLVIPQHKSCFRSELITKDQQLTMNMAGTCESKVGPIPSICPNWHLSTDTNSPTTYIKALKKTTAHIVATKTDTKTFQTPFKTMSKTFRKRSANHQKQHPKTINKKNKRKNHTNTNDQRGTTWWWSFLPMRPGWISAVPRTRRSLFRDLQYTCDDWFIHNKFPSYRILGW